MVLSDGGEVKRGCAPSRYQAMLSSAALTSNIPVDKLRGKTRDPHSCMTRWRVWRDLYADGFSLPGIGKAANRHHTTVMYGIKCIEASDAGGKFVRPYRRPKLYLAQAAE